VGTGTAGDGDWHSKAPRLSYGMRVTAVPVPSSRVPARGPRRHAVIRAQADRQAGC